MSVYRFKSPGVNNEFLFSTSMHYYNREIATIEDAAFCINPTTINNIRNFSSPYEANS